MQVLKLHINSMLTKIDLQFGNDELSLSAYDDKIMCLFSIVDGKVTMMELSRKTMPSEGL